MNSRFCAALACLGITFTGCGLPNEEELSLASATGPEALQWLRKNQNESALASNRFMETENAVRFVEELYTAGAKRVIVPDDCITADQETLQWEGGPYADALIVTLPPDNARRQRVLSICEREIAREGFDPDENMGGDQIFLWWD
jgi:hypothetical protein